jgi:hypothetical protein
MTRAQKKESGFALIIVAALFIAFAMVAAAMVDRTTATQQMDLRASTQAKLSKISYALIAYSFANSGRYPCPASPSVLPTNAAFGSAVLSCEIDPPLIGTDIAPLTGSNNKSLIGMVPVRELVPYGIVPEDAFDAWGNRILYVMHRDMTPSGDGVVDPNERLVVGVPYRESDFLLLSYGRDGIGATTRAMTTIAITCDFVSTDPRMENCNNDLVFSLTPVMAGPSVTAATYFDDVLSLYGR